MQPDEDRRNALERNLEYYGTLSGGRNDYWRFMAAPRYRVATILRLVKRFQPSSLADMGCGNGQLLQEISRQLPGLGLSGLDLSEDQIASNRQRSPSIDFSVLDLQVRPLPPVFHRRFDVIVAAELIEHLDAPETFLENCRNMLVPGRGHIILSTQSGTIRETERRVGHQRHYEVTGMRTLLERGGWRDIEVWNTGFPFHDLSKWYANLRPETSMKQFGGEAYGPGKRMICWLLRGAFVLNSERRGGQLFATALAPREA